MAKNPTKMHVDVETRRQQVAALFLKGHSQADIAERLEVDRHTVAAALTVVVSGWKATAIKDIDTAKAIELEKLVGVEAAAWQGYEESRTKQDKEGCQYIGDPNPSFLGVILASINQRCKILGIDSPKGKGGNSIHFHGAFLSREQMREAVQKQLSNYRSKAIQVGTGLPAVTLDEIEHHRK